MEITEKSNFNLSMNQDDNIYIMDFPRQVMMVYVLGIQTRTKVITNPTQEESQKNADTDDASKPYMVFQNAAKKKEKQTTYSLQELVEEQFLWSTLFTVTFNIHFLKY